MKVSKQFLTAAFATVLTGAATTTSHGAVVINEVYGGGGNTGAQFNQDFVELFNNGAMTENIGGFALQYASATGSFTNTITTLAAGTTIAPGQFFLVGAGPASGTVGSPLPSPSATGPSNPNLSATNGAVRLVDAATTPQVVDLVGYGTAVNFEGLAAAPAGTNTTSLGRTLNGVDTNQNAVDFSSQTPTPGQLNIPEPAGLGLLAVGGLLLARRKRVTL